MDKLLVILILTATMGSTEVFENSLISLRSEGEIQYDLATREAQMPRYGACYKSALTALHKGCEELNDEIQSRLSLAFTNCYLNRFGWTVYSCTNDQSLEQCMEHMDARATSVYSAMLTNTLAMCHFLQGQAWHQATNNAIHSLTSTSEAVSSQLSQAMDSAANLREQLDSQLLESREALRSAFSEMRESTAEQRSLIIDVFDRVAQLQALVMGEFTWFYSIVFYVSCVFVCLVVTCTPRTISARLPLLVLLSISLLTERAMTSVLLANPYSETLQEDLHKVVWNVRHISILLSFCIVIRAAFLYKDPIAVTAARLDELACVTAEIRKLISSTADRGIELSSMTLASMSCVFEESVSSDDSYFPSDESLLEDSDLDFSMPMDSLTERTAYVLRSRSTTPILQNPLVAVESPEAFERIVKRRENLSRHMSRFQARQYFRCDDT